MLIVARSLRCNHYDRYAERIHRLHLARSHDRDAALDLTAETFAEAWLALDRFRDLADGSPGPGCS
jgi:DNA-directed RNA polymerase specialized sigma24 family protein